MCEELAATDDVEAQALWRSTRARLLAPHDAPEAERLAREAVELARTTDGLVMQANALLDLAAVLAARGQVTAAHEAATEAAELNERKGNVVGLGAVKQLVAVLPPAEATSFEIKAVDTLQAAGRDSARRSSAARVPRPRT